MCLIVLNVSDNKMTSLRNLSGFRELNTLEAKDNLIDDIDDLTTTISTLPALKDLSLQGNPVIRFYRYRENLIANSISLGKVYIIVWYSYKFYRSPFIFSITQVRFANS